MDYLWTPWRYNYIAGIETRTRPGVPAELNHWPGPDTGCVFCNLIASVDYAIGQGMEPELALKAGGILWRTESCFLCLNAFPYSSGHVMAIPYEHQASLAALPPATTTQLMEMARRTETALRQVYHPDGINMGLNLGKAAGAGVAEHLHLHALPRWLGDTNFMTVIGETRVLPEDLATTWNRLREALQQPV